MELGAGSAQCRRHKRERATRLESLNFRLFATDWSWCSEDAVVTPLSGDCDWRNQVIPSRRVVKFKNTNSGAEEAGSTRNPTLKYHYFEMETGIATAIKTKTAHERKNEEKDKDNETY